MAKLRDQFQDQCAVAHAASAMRTVGVVLVCLARAPGFPTRVVIQGNTVTDYVWQRQRELGARFRALRAYQYGKPIPIPAELRHGV